MRRRSALVLLAGLLTASCASRGRSFGPATAERAGAALSAWQEAAAKARVPGDANLLYEAALSQKVLRSDGTLAVRLRGESVEGTLSGPFGSPIAVYRDGMLSGEKIESVRVAPAQLRALLSGSWIGSAPAVAGLRGEQVLLEWTGGDAAEGVFDLRRGELLSLQVERPEGELEARFSGTRDPWPERIEIEEKRTGSLLRLKRVAAEWMP